MHLIRNFQFITLLLVALLSVAFIYATYFAINNVVAEQSKVQQQAISPVYRLVNEQLLKPLHIAQTFASSLDFNNSLETAQIDEAVLLAQLKRLHDKTGMVFFVASEKARKQYFSDGNVIDLIEGKVFWYFEALKVEQDVIADLGQVGDVHLFFDVKIYGSNDEFLGFVGVGKRLQTFLDSFQQYKKQYGYDFLFVNDVNDIILTSLPDLVVTGEHIPKLDSLKWYQESIKQQQDLDSLLISNEDEDFLISEFTIEELNWRLLLLVPLKERQAQITKSFIDNTLIAFSLVALLFIASFYFVMFYKRRLENQIELDHLSGLPNRNFIQRRYNQLRRKKLELCTIIVDLDHFKQVNDTYGHNAGDFIIQKASEILSFELRRMDMVGRWGGEEFVMLIPTSSPQEGLAIAERARQLLEKASFDYEGTVIKVTASFGVASGNASLSLSKLLANADLALYEAKKKGRNRVEMYQQPSPGQTAD
ncbi:sensor domain-containing diguanylate cyclase [Aliikangiella marina]|uniref:sensor domain-containing diguanylate cyclase n=1 Tax=Aliikangiella marina TaxID=1712262 RepID=UPI00163DD397|nr:diguanylate cyclase [Aliikangiella marina]